MKNKILLTCGAGKISKVISPVLLKTGYKIRAFVHSEESAQRVRSLFEPNVNEGNFETFVGDLENPLDVKKISRRY